MVNPEKLALAEKRWTAILEEDGDDLVMPLPEELLEELNWNIGDTLTWSEHDEGSWSIRKQT
jgi:antitoxin component of MazEF toxin-antitoxin module